MRRRWPHLVTGLCVKFASLKAPVERAHQTRPVESGPVESGPLKTESFGDNKWCEYIPVPGGNGHWAIAVTGDMHMNEKPGRRRVIGAFFKQA